MFIDIDFQTATFVAKLNAISRHTKALADELELIDAEKCNDCGKPITTTTLFNDMGKPNEEMKWCDHCESYK